MKTSNRENSGLTPYLSIPETTNKTERECNPLSVLVVDDHPIVSAGLKLMLKRSTEFRICATATRADEALARVNEFKPDFIVLDLILEESDGLTLIRPMLAELPKARVLVYSSLEERLYAPRAFRLGAHGYVMKSAGLSDLIDAMRTVARGDVHASSAIARLMLNQMVQKKDPGTHEPFDTLSNGEIRVLRSIALGLSSTRIAQEMGISPKTVSSYKERIKDKLNSQSTRELEEQARRCFGTGLDV